MTKYLLFILLIIISNLYSCKKQDELNYKVIGTNFDNQYKDFVYISRSELWTLTINNDLIILNLETQEINKKIISQSKLYCLAKDKYNNIFAVNYLNEVIKYNRSENQWVNIGKNVDSVFCIRINSKGDIFIIDKQGIHILNSPNNYIIPYDTYEPAVDKNKEWLPVRAFMDNSDNIWFAFNSHDVGDIHIFNTHELRFFGFSKNKLNHQIFNGYISSFFEDNKNQVYTTNECVDGGFITIFKNFELKDIIENDSLRLKMIHGIFNISDHYFIYGDFEKSENCIYFYSQYGFFKGNINKNLNVIENWHKFTLPKFGWEQKGNDYYSKPLDIRKMKVIGKDEFIFISKEIGIGYYKDNKLISLQY